MKPDRVKLQTRLPVKLHARLTKAARTNKRSLHAEMLARLEVTPERVERMLDRIERNCTDQIRWAQEEMVRSLERALMPAAQNIIRRLRNGDVPVLVNEELARINRQVLRDEVRAAIDDAKGKP